MSPAPSAVKDKTDEPKGKSRTEQAADAATDEQTQAQTDAATDGEGTTPAEPTESDRDKKAREKAEAEAKARAEKIEQGLLIVDSDRSLEFEVAEKETKVNGQVQQIVTEYAENPDTPHIFAEIVSRIKAKYPEDLIPAMHALEFLGIVKRYDAKSTVEGAGNRRQTSYQWAPGLTMEALDEFLKSVAPAPDAAGEDATPKASAKK